MGDGTRKETMATQLFRAIFLLYSFEIHHVAGKHLTIPLPMGASTTHTIRPWFRDGKINIRFSTVESAQQLSGGVTSLYVYMKDVHYSRHTICWIHLCTQAGLYIDVEMRIERETWCINTRVGGRESGAAAVAETDYRPRALWVVAG